MTFLQVIKKFHHYLMSSEITSKNSKTPQSKYLHICFSCPTSYLYFRPFDQEGVANLATVQFIFQKPFLDKSKLGNFEPATIVLKTGPGEGGLAYKITDRENDVAQSISDYGMNMVVSDTISLNRTLPDLRMPE